MVTNMGKMEKQMKDVTETEEQVEMKVTKMEDAMWKMNQKIADVKNQTMENLKKIDEHVISNAFPFGWKWYGFGYYGSQGDYVYKYHTTQGECFAFCNNKRATDGEEWNGMNWAPGDGACECSKNDRGHTSSKSYMHWKTN